MAPRNRIIHQYGSSKRMTAAERLFNMKDCVRIKGELRAKGELTSNNVQATDTSIPNQHWGRQIKSELRVKVDLSSNEAMDVNILKQQQAVSPFPQPQPEDNIFSSVTAYQDASDEMLPDAPEYSCTATLPSDNIIDLEEEDAENETITTTDVIQEHQIIHNQPNPHNNSPFRFLDLPTPIRTTILQMLLRTHSIHPFYNHCSVELPEHLSPTEDFDTSLLLANKQLLSQASDILYTLNTFTFTTPEPALWFLKRIGPTNLSKLRTANFILDTGESNQAFGVPREKLWRNLFEWLKPRHRLEHLAVSFRKWHHTSEERERVIKVLLSYRGVERVTVRRGGCISKPWVDILERVIMGREGERFMEVEEFNWSKLPGRGALVFRQ